MGNNDSAEANGAKVGSSSSSSSPQSSSLDNRLNTKKILTALDIAEDRSIVHVKHSTIWEEQFYPLTKVHADEMDDLRLSDVIGRSNAEIVAIAWAGAKQDSDCTFMLTLHGGIRVVALLCRLEGQGCCAMPMRRLWLLLEHQASAEKALTRAVPGTPLLFLCIHCDQVSSDGRRFSQYSDLLRSLLASGHCMLHRYVTSPCGRCAVRSQAKRLSLDTTSHSNQSPTTTTLTTSASAESASTDDRRGGGRRRRGDDEDDDDDEAVPQAASSQWTKRTTPTAVIVQPDAKHRKRLIRAVEGLQITAHSFERAESALEFLRCGNNQQCSVVLVDVVLPGMSGTRFMTTLKQTLKMEATPIIAFGGSPTFAGAATSAGANTFLTRDCDDVVLNRALFNTLSVVLAQSFGR